MNIDWLKIMLRALDGYLTIIRRRWGKYWWIFPETNYSGGYKRKTKTVRKMSIFFVCFKLSRVNEQGRAVCRSHAQSINCKQYSLTAASLRRGTGFCEWMMGLSDPFTKIDGDEEALWCKTRGGITNVSDSTLLHNFLLTWWLRRLTDVYLII